MSVSDLDAVCRSEAQRVVTALRANRRFGSQSRGWRELEEGSPLRQLCEWRSAEESSPSELLAPLLRIICSPEFGGPATFVALEATYSIVVALCEEHRLVGFSLDGDASGELLSSALAKVCKSVCDCVFEETNAQTDEATAAQMITVLGFCCTVQIAASQTTGGEKCANMPTNARVPAAVAPDSETAFVAAFPAEARLKAFAKVLSLWGHYRQSHTLRAFAQASLQKILDHTLADLASPAKCELLGLILGNMAAEAELGQSIEHACLYLRCIQRVMLQPAARRWALAEGQQGRFFQNDIPLLLLSLSKAFGTSLPVLSLILPVANRVCWLCVDAWSDSVRSDNMQLRSSSPLGALQVEALLGGVYLRGLDLAIGPLLTLEAPSSSLAPEEAVQLVELLLESLSDLFQPGLVQTVWASFDCDWRRPPLLEQLSGKVMQLVLERPPTSERPLPGHLAQLCSAVLGRLLSGFLHDDTARLKESVKDPANGQSELDRIQQQWKLRTVVQEFMNKLEEGPKKARAAFEKSGLADVIPVPPLGHHAAGDAVPEESVRKLVWLLRCVNYCVPYAATGEFFGQPKEDSEKAVAAFVDTFDWGPFDIERAMRSFLEAFLLPKEAQQIDRILKTFAHVYYQKHVDYCMSLGKEGSLYLKHPDAAYTLAFSVILLNSDQHNPKLKKRMTAKDFISNNRGINEGENIPEDVQMRIFQSIQKNEIKTPNSGSLVEGISPSRWEDFIQLLRKGWRDNSLLSLPDLSSQAQAFTDRLGKPVRTVLEFALSADSGAHADALLGMERVLQIMLQCHCGEADGAAEGLFLFGSEVFHETQGQTTMLRSTSCLRSFFRTALHYLPVMSTKQLHLLVYLTVQFAVYGLFERALGQLEPSFAKLLLCPALVVDPPTGRVYSFLRKISTAPFKMLSFAEDGGGVGHGARSVKGPALLPATPSRSTSAPVDDVREEDLGSPATPSRLRSAEDFVDSTFEGAQGDFATDKPEMPDIEHVAEDSLCNEPLRPQIQLVFEACELEMLVKAFVAPWQHRTFSPTASSFASPREDNGVSADADAGGCQLGANAQLQRELDSPSAAASDSASTTAFLCYLSSLFLALRAGAQNSAQRPSKDQELPWWPEPPVPPSISTPMPLQLPKRALALNVLDGYETLRLALRLLLATVGQLKETSKGQTRSTTVVDWDSAAMQELSVCTHVGFFYTLSRKDLCERTLRTSLAGLFQTATALLLLEKPEGFVISLGWPVRLIESLLRRLDSEPQLLVSAARLTLEAIRGFVTEVSCRRKLDLPELWRALLQLLLRSTPTSSRALWPGAKDKEVEIVQMQLWRRGLIWLLGHPDLQDSRREEKASSERGSPSGTAVSNFWSWALAEITTLAQDIASTRGTAAIRLLLGAYKQLLSRLVRNQSAKEYAEDEPGLEPDTEELSGSVPGVLEDNARCGSSSSAIFSTPCRHAARAAAWSRVAVSMLTHVAPLVGRPVPADEPDLGVLPLLRQTLLHVSVPLLLAGPHGPHWTRCVLEKLVSLLTPVTSVAPLSVLRDAVSLVSKFFLANLQSLQQHECFGQLWLMVLRLMLQFIKRGADERDAELEEVATETLRNFLGVLVSSKVLGFVSPKSSQQADKSAEGYVADQPVWWQMTWDCIEVFMPGFGDEFSKSVLGEAASAEASVLDEASSAEAPVLSEAASEEAPVPSKAVPAEA